MCKVPQYFVLSSVSELVFQSADSRRDMGWLTVRRRPRCAFPHQSPSAVHLSLCLLFTRAPPPSPSICLVQLPARFLFLCVCIRPTMHPVCIPCCAIHLPRPTSNTPSAFSTTHLLPCRPILPLALPPLGPTTGCIQCTSLLWSRVAALGKSASAGDPRLWVA